MTCHCACGTLFTGGGFSVLTQPARNGANSKNKEGQENKAMRGANLGMSISIPVEGHGVLGDCIHADAQEGVQYNMSGSIPGIRCRAGRRNPAASIVKPTPV
jgi:hypothetical protein